MKLGRKLGEWWRRFVRMIVGRREPADTSASFEEFFGKTGRAR